MQRAVHRQQPQLIAQGASQGGRLALGKGQGDDDIAQVGRHLRRADETRRAGFTKAFATTALELSAILEARAVAGSKAEGARASVLTMLAIMAVIMAMMLSSPAIRAGYATPTAQLVAAGALGMMAYGYTYLNGMIADALEG